MSRIKIGIERPKMSNSDFISLSCELAHERLLEVSKNSMISLIQEKHGGTCYTEEGQDIFNEYYDSIQSILEKYIEEEK